MKKKLILILSFLFLLLFSSILFSGCSNIDLREKHYNETFFIRDHAHLRTEMPGFWGSYNGIWCSIYLLQSRNDPAQFRVAVDQWEHRSVDYVEINSESINSPITIKGKGAYWNGRSIPSNFQIGDWHGYVDFTLDPNKLKYPLIFKCEVSSYGLAYGRQINSYTTTREIQKGQLIIQQTE